MQPKVVQRHHSGNGRSQRRGNLRIGRVGPVLRIVDQVLVNVSVKGRAHLAGRSAELNHGAPARNWADRKSMAAEPLRDLLDVLLIGAKSLPELFRAEPCMEVRRAWVLLLGQKLLQRGFALRAAL